jgi:hypothetical protein
MKRYTNITFCANSEAKSTKTAQKNERPVCMNVNKKKWYIFHQVVKIVAH